MSVSMNRSVSPLALALGVFGALAVASVGCGGRVSLGDDGNGTNALGLADGGVDAPLDSAAASPGEISWPEGRSGLDGGLDYPAAGAFNQFVWLRWWDCGGATCAQEMWINADCKVYWNDREQLVGTGTMDAKNCADFPVQAQSLDLASTLGSDPTPSFTAKSSVGGEIMQYHTGGPGGPWYRARTETSTASVISMARKYVVVGTRSIAGAKESDPNLPR